MHGFLTISAKARPLFGKTMRIPLQSFIDIIYKVPVWQVQPKDDDSACDRCESPGNTEVLQLKGHVEYF